MADSSAQDKQLPASARKLQKAREEGQVARSRDLGHFGSMATGLGLMMVLGSSASAWAQRRSAWWRLLALCAAVIAAGTVTAWLAGRAAAGRDAVQAVKEDW